MEITLSEKLTLTIAGESFACENGLTLTYNRNLAKTGGVGSRSDARNVGAGQASITLEGLDRVFEGILIVEDVEQETATEPKDYPAPQKDA